MKSAKTLRNSKRFNPEAGRYVLLDFNDPRVDFKPMVPGLIFNEGDKGLGLVVLTAAELEVGDDIRLQLNDDEDIRNASVRWVKEIDENVVSIGVEYIEE